MRARTIALILIWTLCSSWFTPANAASLQGKACSKSGATKFASGLKYVCKKSGNRLVWQRVVRSTSTTPTPTPTPTPTAVKLKSSNGVLGATAGCGNRIYLTALTNGAEVESERLVATGPSNVQLIPLDSKQKPDRILVESFNCTSSARALFEVTLGSPSTFDKLPDFDPGWTLIDAGYDPPRDAPLALIRDASWNYRVMLRTGLSWTLIWQSSLSRLQTYVDKLQTATGYEFYLYGDRQGGGGWNRIRVMKDGYAYVNLRGTGSIRAWATSLLEEVDAYITYNGIWVCESLLSQLDLPTTANDRCSIISETSGKSGIFTFAQERNAHWFVYSTDYLFSATYAAKVECGPGSSLFVCTSPKITTTASKRVMDYRQNLVWVWVGDMDFLSLSPAYLS